MGLSDAGQLENCAGRLLRQRLARRAGVLAQHGVRRLAELVLHFCHAWRSEFHFGRRKAVQHCCLKRESEAEFDLTGRAQRVDAGSDTHTINIVTAVCSSVDLPHSARE